VTFSLQGFGSACTLLNLNVVSPDLLELLKLLNLCNLFKIPSYLTMRFNYLNPALVVKNVFRKHETKSEILKKKSKLKNFTDILSNQLLIAFLLFCLL